MKKHWKVEIWIDEELEGFDGKHLIKSDFDAVEEEIDEMWHGVKVVYCNVHEEKEEKR